MEEVLNFLQAKSYVLALNTVRGYCTTLWHRFELVEQEGGLVKLSISILCSHGSEVWLRPSRRNDQ